MTSGQKVLLIEDDEALRNSLSEQLHLHEEFETHTATTGAEALDACKKGHFDLIILDVGLPDMDGREVCRLIRRSGVWSPILMLTGANTEADTILGLNSGANDYITKPFKLSVLWPASVRSCASTSARRTRSSPSAPIPSARPPSR